MEQRGGKPATVKGTSGDEEAGILRIDFPGYSGEQSRKEISWDEFFKQFDEHKLALVFDEKSNFNKIISRDSAK